MGHEINYRTWERGIYAKDAASDAEDSASYLDKIEQQIFAYMCMGPDQVQVNSKDDEKDECAGAWKVYEDNAAYLSRVWNDLKEQWRDTHRTLVVAEQIKGALENNEYVVEVCPECLHQVRYRYDKDKADFVWECPEHGVVEKPKKVTLYNVEEDD